MLAVPIFALIIEFIGYRTKDQRYDRLAHEFTKLLSVSFSLTATFGAMLTFVPDHRSTRSSPTYLVSVFSPTFLPYVLLFFFEAVLPLHLLLRLGEVLARGSTCFLGLG